MLHKTFELIETKADGDAGEFTALASVFGNVDLVGDRMLPGAFKNTLSRWRATGDPIPIILSHQWEDPMMNIGGASPDDVEETERGLVVKGKLDIGRNPVADQVFHLMKSRRLKGWSFGYTVPEGGEKMREGVNEVSEVDLVEVGPTLKGANPQAETEAVKSLVAEAKQLEDVPAEQSVQDQEPEDSNPQTLDPLREQSRRAVLEIVDGTKLHDPTERSETERELRRRSRQVVLDQLRG